MTVLKDFSHIIFIINIIDAKMFFVTKKIYTVPEDNRAASIKL